MAQLKIQSKGDFTNRQCGTGYAVLNFIIYAAIAYAASLLLKPKLKSPIQDDKPTTLTIRGSFTPWQVGIRMVGPVFAWAGDRVKIKRKAGGGKGTNSPTTDEWYEGGWHLLGVGPCHALHKITQSGKIIFQGPITSVSHPSGTLVDASPEGSFYIYWGEDTQPVNTILGDAARVGVSSRWPNCCYVLWMRKKLGGTAVWPKLDYEMERRPTNAILNQTAPWYDPTPTLTGLSLPILGVLAHGNPDIGYLEIFILGHNGQFLKDLIPGQPIKITGNSLPDGNYIIRRIGYPDPVTANRIYLEAGTAGANAAGTIETFAFSTDSGANVAHAVAELLFADFPLGLSLPTGDPEPWDLLSLEAWGVEAEAQGWRSSIVSVDGDEAQGLLAGALQDHGVLLPFDITNGYLTFQRVRLPVGTLPLISVDLEGESLPEIHTYHGERKTDRMVFSFSDRDHGYSNMTIASDEDGQISYTEYARATILQMPSVIHFDTAAKLTEVRSQEQLGGAAVFKLEATREARLLIPGTAILCSHFDEVLRVLECNWDPLSDAVTLSVIPDFYGARVSDFILNPGGGGGSPTLTLPNLEHAYVEIPEQLLATEEMFILSTEIRAHAQISASLIHLSRDGSTYTLWGTEPGFTAGGETDVAMTATSASYQANGPTFTVEGPDLANVLDLSADPVNFGLGRQIVVISSSAGIEICFVEKITSISGTQARLDGLLRARYDTRKLAHPIGAAVFIFENTLLRPIDDILLVPGEVLYVKAQPLGSGNLSLTAVTPFVTTLRGKGLRPVNVEALHTRAPFMGSATWRTGDDVTIAWSWSSSFSKNTGAGFQPAGAAIGAPTLKGSFLVELLTLGLSLVSSQTLLVAEVTYTAAELAAAPISDSSFTVRVTQQYNGYLSDPVTFTVIHI